MTRLGKLEKAAPFSTASKPFRYEHTNLVVTIIACVLAVVFGTVECLEGAPQALVAYLTLAHTTTKDEGRTDQTPPPQRLPSLKPPPSAFPAPVKPPSKEGGGKQSEDSGSALTQVPPTATPEVPMVLEVIAKIDDETWNRTELPILEKRLGGLVLNQSELEQAADDGNARAAAMVAEYALIKGNVSEPELLSKALQRLSNAAKAGESHSEVDMASIFLIGKFGVPVDHPAMLRLLKASAAQRNPDAEAMLGTLYVYGEGGVSRDSEKAKALLTDAAQGGNRGAEALLNEVRVTP